MIRLSIQKGDAIRCREGKETGEVRSDLASGGGRPCACGHRRIAVKWADGEMTWPCTDAITRDEKGWRLV